MTHSEAIVNFTIRGSKADIEQFWDGVFVDHDSLTIDDLESMFVEWLALAGDFYHACILPAFDVPRTPHPDHTLVHRMFALYTAMCENEIEF